MHTIPSLPSDADRASQIYLTWPPSSHDSWFLAAASGDEATLAAMVADGSAPKLDASRPARDTKDCHTAAMLAAAGGHASCLSLLRRAGADMDAHNAFGHSTPLLMAAAHKQTECCLLLIGMGADVDAAAPDGMTPAALAAHRGDAQALRALLAAGCDASIRDQAGNAPLHHGAAHGHTECVSLLANTKCGLDAANDKGQTPASLAVKIRDPETLRVLAKAGCDLDARHHSGFRPDRHDLVAWACEDNNSPCLRVLVDEGACLSGSPAKNSMILEAARSGYIDCLDILIAAGVDLEYSSPSDKPGTTALVVAASHGRMECAQALVDAGCDLSVLDKHGLAAANSAREARQFDCASWIESLILAREIRLFQGENPPPIRGPGPPRL